MSDAYLNLIKIARHIMEIDVLPPVERSTLMGAIEAAEKELEAHQLEALNG